MAKVFHLTRVPDAAILAFFKEISEINSPASVSFEAVGYLKFQYDEKCNIPEEYVDLFNSNSFFIDGVVFKIEILGISVIFRRGFQQAVDHTGAARWEKRQPFIDSIEIDLAVNEHFALPLGRAMQNHLPMAPPLTLTDSAETALQQSSMVLSEVTAAAAQIAAHTAERHRQLDELKQELENRASASLEATRDNLAAEYKARIAQLESREEQINARAADLDDRENTHVRRQVRNELVGEVERLLGAPLLAQSNASFNAVVRTSGLVGATLLIAALATNFLLKGVTDQNAIVFTEVTRVLLGLGAASAIWFAIRQAASRYRQVSTWENELHRFRLDTERASFLIEGDLEARKIGGKGLPDVMLDRLSRGLFSTDRENENPDPVGNTLVHLLNRPAGLEIGTNGVKVNVDKASLRKAGKEIESDA